MWTVEGGAEIDAVDSCLMPNKGIVGCGFGSTLTWGSNGPDLDGAIQGGRGKHARVFGINGNLHDVVFMILIRIYLLPRFIPVKELNGLVV